MAELQRILVPTDFSVHAEKALKLAIAFAREWGAQIDLFHVIQWPTHYAYPLESDLYVDLTKQAHDSATQKLEEISQAVASEDVRVASHIKEGIAPREIIEAADAFKTKLIVLGTRGVSGLKHHLLGSVAERTVRLAACPVVTVTAKDDQP